MSIQNVQELMRMFEEVKISDGEDETWSARDLCQLFEYNWRNFEKVIKKAKTTIKHSGENPDISIDDSDKFDMLTFGVRKLKDYRLTRAGAYMVAMNADPAHKRVAFAKIYFGLQTRRAELIEQALLEIDERVKARKELSHAEKDLGAVLYERGVTGPGIGMVRSAGDSALFGVPTRRMKEKLGIKHPKPLADKLHTIAIKAKELSAAMTVHNADEKELIGQAKLQMEHVDNNLSVREALGKRGIQPENLPPGEDTAPVIRRLRAEERKTLPASTTPFLPPEPTPDPPGSTKPIVSPHQGEQLGLGLDLD